MSKQHDKLLTVEEAAQRLGLSVFGVYRRASSGEVPSIRVGRFVRFSEQDLASWINSKRQAARRASR